MAQQKMALIKEEPSLGDLFSELAAETGTLIRQEVALAQVELTEKAASVGKDGYLVVGGAVGYAAMLVMLAAAVIILATFIPLWASALLVGAGAAVGIVSYFLVTSALAELKKVDLAPREMVESIKEDAQWLKKQVS